jgi:hypothetical protein
VPPTIAQRIFEREPVGDSGSVWKGVLSAVPRPNPVQCIGEIRILLFKSLRAHRIRAPGYQAFHRKSGVLPYFVYGCESAVERFKRIGCRRRAEVAVLGRPGCIGVRRVVVAVGVSKGSWNARYGLEFRRSENCMSHRSDA